MSQPFDSSEVTFRVAQRGTGSSTPRPGSSSDHLAAMGYFTKCCESSVLQYGIGLVLPRLNGQNDRITAVGFRGYLDR